jgi:hypothetical protein
MAPEKTEIELASNDMKENSVEGASVIYIDPVMERRIVRKFDWLVLPQFVIIIILG